MQTKFERRKQRSEQLRRAIRYQFRQVVKEYNIKHFTLADQRGLLVASADDSTRCEVLAAYAPLFTRIADSTSRENMMRSLSHFAPEVKVHEITVLAFQAAGEPLFLCAVGESGAARDAGIYRAISGIRRILSY